MPAISILVAESAPANTLSPTRGVSQQQQQQQQQQMSLSPARGVSSNGRVVEIASEKLQQSIKSLCENMSEVLKDTQQIGAFALKEVKLEVEISAEGTVVLIGKAGVKGAISLTFAP